MDTYHMRAAQSKDLVALPLIEREAAKLFRDSPYPELVGAELAAQSLDLATDQVWVAADDLDIAVGFLILRPRGQQAHIHELDVHPDHGRRGLGRALLEHAASWARREGYTAITLTTFSDVPWNGPFYERFGFRVLDGNELSPELEATLTEEAESGIAMHHRVAMIKVL